MLQQPDEFGCHTARYALGAIGHGAHTKRVVYRTRTDGPVDRFEVERYSAAVKSGVKRFHGINVGCLTVN
jgi:hypothetical protein